MITIGMNYEIVPGRDQEFEEKFRTVIDSFERNAGHHRSHLFRDVHSPQSYLIHSEWETKDAFMDFIRSDEFRRVTSWGREGILADRPRHRIYGEE